MEILTVILLLFTSPTEKKAPLKMAFPVYQTGTASWYGKEQHNHLTATGKRFNMYAMTAAHRKLPFGTLIKVTDIKTSKSVEVVVNDRGPYAGNRIVDLSMAAAIKLGIKDRGLAKVTIQILWQPEKKQKYDKRPSKRHSSHK